MNFRPERPLFLAIQLGFTDGVLAVSVGVFVTVV